MIFSVITGLCIGLYFNRNRVHRAMLLAYHLPFRFWRSYSVLYDAVESRFTYDMISKPSEETFADFLRRYDIARPHAVSHFKAIWDSLALQVGRDYAIVLIYCTHSRCVRFSARLSTVRIGVFDQPNIERFLHPLLQAS